VDGEEDRVKTINLEEAAKQIRKACGDEARGPLIIAKMVVDLDNNWDRYREESGVETCREWLAPIAGSGRTPKFFAERLEAVQAVGEHARRHWHHEALIWAMSLPSHKLHQLDLAVTEISKLSGGCPLNKKQVKRLARNRGLIPPPQRVVCQKCRLLEAALRKVGVDPLTVLK
jgi:hypothetical protein